MQHIWQDCSRLLENELTPQQFSAWIKPLKALDFDESTATLTIGAPNRLKLDAIRSQFSDRIAQAASRVAQRPVAIVFAVDGASALAAAPQFDILVNNAGGPPPGDFRDWDRDAWIKALDANMLTPIELIKATVDGMIVRRFGRIVNITSGAVKAPIDILGLSNGARSGLTGFVAGLSRKTVAHNVTINGLLPGAFDTDRLRGTASGAAKAQGKTMDEYLEGRRKAIPAGRFGNIDEFGAACAFLCSVHGGYITGQNLLLDGGSYPGTF